MEVMLVREENTGATYTRGRFPAEFVGEYPRSPCWLTPIKPFVPHVCIGGTLCASFACRRNSTGAGETRRVSRVIQGRQS